MKTKMRNSYAYDNIVPEQRVSEGDVEWELKECANGQAARHDGGGRTLDGCWTHHPIKDRRFRGETSNALRQEQVLTYADMTVVPAYRLRGDPRSRSDRSTLPRRLHEEDVV